MHCQRPCTHAHSQYTLALSCSIYYLFIKLDQAHAFLFWLDYGLNVLIRVLSYIVDLHFGVPTSAHITYIH